MHGRCVLRNIGILHDSDFTTVAAAATAAGNKQYIELQSNWVIEKVIHYWESFPLHKYASLDRVRNIEAAVGCLYLSQRQLKKKLIST
jgi:hypothetical protein